MKYKLLIADFDGTLTDGSIVPEVTVEAIKKYREAGGKFALCSGRFPYSANLRMVESGITCDAIASFQGAVVTVGDKVLYERGLSGKLVATIVREIKEKFGREFTTFYDGKLYHDG
ncbi:MAG: HAD hydrolase family protein, partial [Clostridia bacterium]|nr:HAD hydrolase family protein [Clostridia bacterium]